MMFSEPIELWDAVITAIHHKVEDGNVQTRIMVTGTLDADLAGELDARNVLFSDNGTPKQGFTKLELDTGCAAFRAVFEAPQGLKQTFELMSGDSTDRYTVERQDDSVFRLKLRLNYHGDPHLALGYVMAVGNTESVLKISPLQRTLESSLPPPTVREKQAPLAASATPASTETVRNAIAARGRKPRKAATVN